MNQEPTNHAPQSQAADRPGAGAQESLAERRLVLPGGVLGAHGQACRVVQMRALTGADEEVLFESGALGTARVTAFLLRAIQAIPGLDQPINHDLVSSMHLGDRDYLLLRLRQIELGDHVHQVTRCPGCAKKVDVDFLVSELPVRRLVSPQSAYHLTLGKSEVSVRLPTGADQAAVETLAPANPAAANTLLFSRVVLQCDDHAPTLEELRHWPLMLRAQLTEWLEANAPGPDLFLDLSCPYCRSDMSYFFDLYSFFLPSN